MISKLHKLEKTEGRDGPDLMFWCPGCQCGHGVWLPRWTWNGNFEKPTFTPSLLVTTETATPPVTPENLAQWNEKPWLQTTVRHICHSVITDGIINFCPDSTHALRGQSIFMEEF